MKKIILVLLVLFTVSFTANAQFTLTKNGLVSTENPELKYIVLEFPGKTQQELFQNVNVYLHSLQSNPRRSLRTIEDQAIMVDMIAHDSIFMAKILGVVQTGDLSYNISFEFKDGRVKVNAPTNLRLFVVRPADGEAEIVRARDGKPVNYVDGIFDRRGKIREPKIKQSIENYFHNYILQIFNAVNSEW